MTHYNTFRDQLAIAHPAFGYALWEPDPGEQYPPVEVGDVGFVRQGKFHRLFNALLPANHPSHRRFGVPEHYEPLQPSVPDHIDHGTLNPNNFCSYGVTVESGESGLFAVEPPTSDSAEVSFSCTRKDGAALSLPVLARREDTLSQAHFGRWMTRHIDSLFAFSQRHGLGIEMEDMVLVTGYHRTRSWSNIAFYETQSDSRVSLQVQTPSTLGTTVHWRVLSQRIQGAMLSHGPCGENLPENQCLFIRGFRVKRLFWIIPRLRGAAEPQPDHDREPELELVPIPSITECRDPLHVLLEYIGARAPDCDMALVHDDDLVRILGVGGGTSLRPDAVMDHLQKSKLEIGVMSDSWSTNNESPKTDTERVTVALLSERLHSLYPTASAPLLSSNTMNAKEMANYHTSSTQSSYHGIQNIRRWCGQYSQATFISPYCSHSQQKAGVPDPK
ncbi:hypothetical protein EI94DRAFT_1015440 [Lactarius quietus]|nr:hypothetical protein EI94DRAFT_1015440 [Lactarius quietus]